MPMPTKFTAKRREIVLVALAAGASRRTAAEVAGIDHSTLVKWIGLGARSSPESRFARFRAEVLAAEAGSHRSRLLPLPSETPPAVIANAWKIVEREFRPEPPEPTPLYTAVISFSDGTPISEMRIDPDPS